MATTNANLKVDLAVSQAGAETFSGGPYWSGAMSFVQALASGTTAGKIDLAYMKERTVSSGASDDIDLAGVLTEALGGTITAAEIVGILLINKRKDGTANTTSLTIGGDANGFEGFLSADGTVGPIGPGGVFLIMNPDASGLGTVTAGTGDILQITNSSGASNTYQIAVLARTA